MEAVQKTGNSTAVHRCLRCNRVLHKTQDSYGPKCARRIVAAAKVLLNSTHPVAKRAAALLLIDGVRRTASKGTYAFTSRDRSTTYLTTTKTCGCLAGQHDKLCCHRAAVLVLTESA